MTQVEKIIQREIEGAVEKAIVERQKQDRMEIAKNLLDVLPIDIIAIKTGLNIKEVQTIKKVEEEKALDIFILKTIEKREYQNKVEFAIKAIAKGFPIQDIAEITKLNIEDITKLKEQ